GQYAWYVENSRNRAWPCGQVMPNDLGLFDMLGNVYEWCLDAYAPYPQGDNEHIDDNIIICESIKDKIPRLLRGGSFQTRPAYVRSAYRYWRYAPALRITNIGLRPSRTWHQDEHPLAL